MADNKGYITSNDEKGSINISEEVLATIAAVAAAEVEGVHGPFISHGKEITSMLGRRGLAKGVKLTIDGSDMIIDIGIIAEIGFSVSEVAMNVQKAVMSAVEDAAGISVSAVNVSICGVALKKKQKG